MQLKELNPYEYIKITKLCGFAQRGWGERMREQEELTR